MKKLIVARCRRFCAETKFIIEASGIVTEAKIKPTGTTLTWKKK